MSEAIISRRGYTADGKVLVVHKIEMISENTTWTIPLAVENKFDVRIFGG